MDNMRRTLRQPGLRMADGGGFGKWVRETVFNAPKDYQPTKPAPAAPAAPAQKAITDYTSGAATERRMKAAGLRDGGDLRTGAGGHVPGKGTGDKVPAKYEPGEFVVSNDMLDAAPGLREDLHGLRGQVLAAKGMTPEQADARALNGGSLRAAVGFGDDRRIMPGSTPEVLNGAAQNHVPQPATQRTGGATGSWGLPTPDSGVRTPDSLRQPLSPAGGWFPGTRAVGRGFADEFSSAMKQPLVVGKVGMGLRALGRGVSAAPLGLIEDVIEPWNRAGTAALGAVGDVAKIAVTGEAPTVPKPDAQPTTPQPTTPQPTTPQPAAPKPPAPKAEAPPSALPAGTSLRSPGVYETRRPGKSVEFGDEASLSDVGFQNRGAISAQNMAAADALDARYAAERAGERASADQAAAPAQTGLRGGLFDTPKARRADRELSLREADSLRSDATARRGQDITLRGQDSTRAVADRGYQLDVQKFGVEAANKRRDDKRAGEAAFDQRVLNFVGTDKDGKPDAAAASRVRNVANAFLSEKLTAARQLLAREPNNKSAQAVIDSITREGVGGIDDDTMRKFMLNEQGNRVAAEYDGWAINPFAGKATNTSRPIGSLRLEDNMILPNQYVTENGQKIPKRAVEANPDLRALIK